MDHDPAISFRPHAGDLDRLRARARQDDTTVAALCRRAVRDLLSGRATLVVEGRLDHDDGEPPRVRFLGPDDDIDELADRLGADR